MPGSRTSTCCICGTGQYTGQIKIKHDTRDNKSNMEHSCVGQIKDICRPMTSRPGSENCLRIFIQKNPTLTFESVDPVFADRWGF
jgi:hypothetical protein